MLTARFGIEIEFTGITRVEAARVAARFLNGSIESGRDYYNTQKVTAADGRVWKFMSDGSIRTQKKENGRIVGAGKEYSVEMVSPILAYREDIHTLQELVRRLRKAGAFTNSSTGIHIHLSGENHTPRSLRNFMNIIASKNDLFYKALQIESDRMRFCKKMDATLVEKMNRRKPKSLSAIETIWYEGYRENRRTHYHSSRYHFLNLHSFFAGNHTVELRGFNSELHAGKIRSYIVLALALNNQCADPEMREQQEAAGRERKVRDADIPQPHRAHRRRVQELQGTPLQAPFGVGGMAVSHSGLGKHDGEGRAAAPWQGG